MFGGHKRLKDALLLIGWNAETGVLNPYMQMRLGCFGSECDAALLGKPVRIAQ